jgi:hypothetical protein
MNVLFGEGRAAVYFSEIEILGNTTQPDKDKHDLDSNRLTD